MTYVRVTIGSCLYHSSKDTAEYGPPSNDYWHCRKLVTGARGVKALLPGHATLRHGVRPWHRPSCARCLSGCVPLECWQAVATHLGSGRH